jgi:hypothetical protein
MQDNKVLKKKKIDKDLTLKITKNEMSDRIFVEFRSDDSKMVLQKSFQDNFLGNQAAEDFQKSIKSTKDLRKYFGLN